MSYDTLTKQAMCPVTDMPIVVVFGILQLIDVHWNESVTVSVMNVYVALSHHINYKIIDVY